MSKIINLRLIYPASKDIENSLSTKKIELKNGTLNFHHRSRPNTSNWPHLSGSKEERLEELLKALYEQDLDGIICGRGGYGSSDLLDDIPWSDLKKLSPKLIIGFSDISALHSAFLAQLAWPGLHAPMPATSYWSENQDIDLTALMETFINPQNPIILNIYETISHPSLSSPIHGWLFGGCLSVLTNLIGTPYFPENLNRAILFWEDIDESPARILRQVNHWIQSKVLLGVQAIILGRFTLSQSRPDLDTRKLGTEIFLRTSIPVFLTQEFGHCSPNIPLLLGGQAQINRSSLSWTRRRPHGTLST